MRDGYAQPCCGLWQESMAFLHSFRTAENHLHSIYILENGEPQAGVGGLDASSGQRGLKPAFLALSLPGKGSFDSANSRAARL